MSMLADWVGLHQITRRQLDLTLEREDDDEESSYCRAEVHLQEGGQDYDIMDWSNLAVSNDVIDQYQKHMHFMHLLS